MATDTRVDDRWSFRVAMAFYVAIVYRANALKFLRTPLPVELG